MRLFLAVHKQEVCLMIKYTEASIKPYNVTFHLAYRTFRDSSIRTSWSRYLEDYNDTLFVGSKDPIKLNMFNPHKRLIKLDDVSENQIVFHILSGFEINYQGFEDIVFFCHVTGLSESFTMFPSISARALDAVMALKLVESGEEDDLVAAKEAAAKRKQKMMAARRKRKDNEGLFNE